MAEHTSAARNSSLPRAIHAPATCYGRPMSRPPGKNRSAEGYREAILPRFQNASSLQLPVADGVTVVVVAEVDPGRDVDVGARGSHATIGEQDIHRSHVRALRHTPVAGRRGRPPLKGERQAAV